MFFRFQELVLCALLIASCPGANAKCPVNTVIIKGQVESVPLNASVRVRLIYAKNKPGETAESTVREDGTFNIPIEFFTQSGRGFLGEWGERCDRRPESVVVILTRRGNDQPIDEVTLNIKRDFKTVDPGAYAPRSAIMLNRTH